MPRRHVTWFGVALVLAVSVTRPAAQPGLRSQLVGHWRLVSTEVHVEGAAPSASLGPNPVGTIVYTADGRVQAHLTLATRPRARAADAAPEVLRELSRYTAYFGTFTVDEASRTVTHHRDGTFVPGERDIVRSATLDGRRLVLKTPTVTVDGRRRYTAISWERLSAAPAATGFDAAARAAVAGTWELVDHRTLLPNGQVRHAFGPTPKGHFIFHPDGHTAVQIVNPDRPASGPDRATDDERRALARTYLAYFGTYDVDPATRKIVVHTVADLNPLNTGVDQIRFFTIEGDTMVLQPPPSTVDGGQQVSRITWRRVR